MHFTPAIVLGLLACTVVGIIPAFRLLLAQRGRPYEDGEGGDGGGGSGVPRGPYLRPGPDEPVWWPEFEREFAGYVSLRDEGRPVRDP
jgi:hypothetical protein